MIVLETPRFVLQKDLREDFLYQNTFGCYQSKIVLCPKGFHSTECFRHYEALKQGCIVISEKLSDSYLYNNSPIIQLDNWNGIRKIVNDLLQDESLLMKKSEESLRWYENVMSEKATAMYVLSKIEQ